MNVLIIDKEPLMLNLLKSKLSQMGHSVTGEDSKTIAIKSLETKSFDCIFIDPSPLKNIRPVVFDVLKSLEKNTHRPYIVLLSKDAARKDALKGFCNDLLSKPFDHSFLEKLMENVARLQSYYRIMDMDEDYSLVNNALGIVDQNAFRQLFLASIDRGFRYGERNFILFVQINNLKEIHVDVGNEKTKEILNIFAEKLSWIRRQSDVVGRVSVNGFGILLQRPMHENEIFDAFSRFQEKLKAMISGIDTQKKLEISLFVVEMPFCSLSFECKI